MKKMLVLVFAVIFMFSGCSKADEGENSSAAENSQLEITSSEEEIVQVEGIEEILAKINLYVPAENGIDLECTQIAVELINWTESLDEDVATKDAITKAISRYCCDMSGEDMDEMSNNFEQVDSMARMMINGVDTVTQALDSVNIELKFNTYSVEKYEKFSTSMRKVLL